MGKVVIIEKSKVYTSYFAKAMISIPSSKLISIANTSPENWNGAYFYGLRPTKELLYGYKSGEISQEEYIKIYRRETLGVLNPAQVYELVKGCVLCCWEKSGKFCHRKLVIDWLFENLGIEKIGGEL